MKSLIKQYLSFLADHEAASAIALLDHGLALDATYGPNRLTPLHLVSTADYPWARDVITELVRRGAVLEARDKGGHTPLHQAAWRAALVPVETLLGLGADVNAQNGLGQTPLIKAVISFREPRSAEVIRALLEHGADPTIVPEGGATAMSLAERWNVALPRVS